ncbi:MAG: bifunctional demethylmenaquinone methyltransferase/2-methoxy-6-polyprenyl-1,4-benzoquinol methylase UbiE [Chitinophagaceae bacterium]|nr:bifunctional demethylmenaquinone methyltransferase/2-methoxy-6-polyprenyl-1,4-benzoquinol methylase UbiE [Chitinophagaceae bacterium]
MGTSVVPDSSSTLAKKEQVEKMFDGIASRYDLLNRVLSFRIDVLWRREVIRILSRFKPLRILDVATGTADLAIALNSLQPEKIVGLDLSAQMLAVGQDKVNSRQLQQKIQLVKGDSESLPFENDSFDAVTVAFGVRNFENLQKGLDEIFRVLKPEASFVILEFSKVKTFPVKQFYQIYFRYITPFVGKLISRDKKAYTYLPNSVAVFPEGEELCVILRQTGFKKVECKPLSFGIASIYFAQK